jgi:gluconolactonase
MVPRFLLSALSAAFVCSCSLLPHGSPVARFAKPHDHGNIGAGEGPAYDNGVLYFTDGKGINQLHLSTGKASVFRTNCGSPNGLMFDGERRLIMCESKGRRVSRLEGEMMGVEPIRYTELNRNPHTVVLADRYEGHRFNSPNDLTSDHKGRIYFTDPRYGPRDTMEMRDAKGRLVEGVYRIDSPGKVTRILGPDDVERPNGIAISHDGKFLFIADNNNNTHGGSRKLLRFDLNSGGSVDPGSRTVIFDWKNGRGPDGVKTDLSGLLYVAAGVNKATDYETNEFRAGCYILSPRGKVIDFVPTSPDEATNCFIEGLGVGCGFGPKPRRTLFMTSGGHLWSVPLK